MPHIKYIQNEDHYKEVLTKASKVKESLWIGTADIKDLYVGDEPFLGVLADLVKKGVDVRLIHAKEPGPIFREEFDRYPILFKKLQRVLCPRVHFKIMLFDYREVYVGSANLTDAGIGAKGKNKRNFEAGIRTLISSNSRSAVPATIVSSPALSRSTGCSRRGCRQVSSSRSRT